VTRTELEAKNKTELLALATSLGFEGMTPATSKADMVAQLLGLTPKEPVDPETAIAADEKRNPLPREGKLRDLQGNLVKSKKVRIMILATEQEQGDVKLSLNGHMLQIKRGVEVEIDEPYLGVLRDSIVSTVQWNPETNQRSAMQIQRYPYQILG
jgi:hypothetical protein